MGLENGKIMNSLRYNIKAVAGDASFRKFYRIRFNNKSKIIVYAEKEKYKNLIVYSAINKFLRNNKILAPKLISNDYKKGIIVIEDFGDKTFYKELLKIKNKFAIYRKLVDLLLKIQKIKPKFKLRSFDGKTYKVNKYSNKYLFQESDLFFDWYLSLFLSKKKVAKIKKKSKKILLKIYNRINFSNSYFVHRDFHVQNLMKVNKKIGVIDSQDALIGNPAYDLVSLIDDIRIKIPANLKKKILNYYLIKTENIYKKNKYKFLEDFNILSVQRNLKIIGIFSRLFKRDNKKQYLRLIPYTWKILEMRMNSKIFLELKQLLNKNVSKKIRRKIIDL